MQKGIYVNLIMTLVLISIVFIALAFAGIAIKILVKKNGRFAGTCSGNNPLLQNEGGACGICGAKPEEKCKS
jgi:rRNA maturation endonuclease Nob1